VGGDLEMALVEPRDELIWWLRMGVALLFATCLAVALHEPARVHFRKRTSDRSSRELAPSR